MPKDIDESLIEATIRRVAEAQAARADGVDAEAEDEAALLDAAPDLDAEPEEDSALEDVVSEGDAAREPLALRSPRAADESLIEATIRRVAASKAASSAQASEDEFASENGARLKRNVVDESHIEATIRRVSEAKAASEEQASAVQAEHAGAVVPQQRVPADAWIRTTERLEARLAQVEESMLTLTRRVEALEPLLEGQSPPQRPLTQPSGYRGHLAAADDDDEWEEQPQAARMAVGLPPRPTIFRDPAPVAASADVDDEGFFAESDELPPAPAPAKRRGLDLLPRTYRITVEDKRRGVDLVPLHRVLLALEGVRDMSLLSYNNGIAIVSLEVVTEIDLDALQQSVSRAMARDAKVELHNENTIVIKLAEE